MLPALLLALALLTGLLGACSALETDAAHGPTASADLKGEVRALLQRHARAVRTGAMAMFLDDVDGSRPAFHARQKRYFRNLQELPLARFGWKVPDGSVTETADGLRAVVTQRMKLRGYDAVPVTTPQALTFVRDDEGRLLLSGDRDPEFAERYGVDPSPWDLERIHVREGDGVLGIFDAGSLDSADRTVAAVERGIAAVDAEVPLPWPGAVVVYALGDRTLIDSIDNLPGGDPDRLDGVAFPVRASPSNRALASTRFLLHPRMVDRDGELRDRLIRHELTHVALGLRDDRVPTWLSEGLAEYVSVQPVPTYRRMIARAAFERARAGVTRLPRNRTFNGPESGAHYGIAWYACEYVAATYGEDALWRLFDAMRAGDGTREKGQDRVLRRVLGIDGHQLARGAADKITATFG
ncbi:hypothetical protein EKO23_07065 [Nocardioides guangzhouensis]|uniref:Peptidase MA-like domain-containing protein n=1 Tax=Nocardioides guangzhouensis TaxID=2497878 RepID=A0A4Q4ZFT0_9ACTN|nr:hypothetical protein [Nocardioides guangzhouensis]RYP87030.1 hypothetical protein EKO23_07065 [Nocardioides guangzhouensis]